MTFHFVTSLIDLSHKNENTNGKLAVPTTCWNQVKKNEHDEAGPRRQTHEQERFDSHYYVLSKHSTSICTVLK